MAAKFAARLAQLPQRPVVGKIKNFVIEKVNTSRKGLGFTQLVVVPYNRTAEQSSVLLSDLYNKKNAFTLMKKQGSSSLKTDFKVVHIGAQGHYQEAKYLVPRPWTDQQIWSLHYESYAFQKGDSHTRQSRAYQSHGLADPNLARMPVGPDFKPMSIMDQAKKRIKYALDLNNSDDD